MKKFMSMLILCTLFLSIVPSNLTHATTLQNNIIINEDELSDTIRGYFNHSLNLQKDLLLTKNDYIFPNSKLGEFTTLSSESMVEWYSSNKGQFDWYNLEINIKSIEKVNDTIKVNVDQKVTCQYIGVNVTTSYINDHVLYLKYNDNKLLVEKDIIKEDIVGSDNVLTDSNKNLSDEEYINYIDDKINVEKEKKQTIDTELKTVEEENNIRHKRSISGGNYNRNSSTFWALANVFSPEDYADNDCTNFVSKALSTGGLRFDNDKWRPGYMSWIRVIELRDYLVSAGKAIEYSSINRAELGDVIQFYNSEYSNWTHSVLVTYDVGDYSLISAHSYPAKNVLFSSYFPGKPFYTQYRVLHIVF